MKVRQILTILAVSVLILPGCKKEKETGDLVLKFSHHADGFDLVFDSLAFNNPAGYTYSVSHLEYYVSNIEVRGADGIIYSDDEVHLINAQDASTLSITLPKVPLGHIMSVSFLLGLDDRKNATGALPNTMENMNMAWPDPMGGGYHFMKLEGNYLDSLPPTFAYALHLGKTGNECYCSKNFHTDFSASGQEFDLQMNLNEWFRNPYLYDFAIDGASSMDSDAALHKLAENGNDVFSN